MSKPLSLLSISGALLSKLNKAGYSTVGDVEGVEAEILARGTRCSKLTIKQSEERHFYRA
jgi:hypothetical protein